MLEGRYVLLFRNVRFLRCWLGQPPPGAIAER